MSLTLSFEFSAPKNAEAAGKMVKVHDRLLDWSPNFFSVTYGAGGSTRDGTRQAVLDLVARGTDVAPHLSFGGDAPETIEALLQDYREAGITRVVALRGDVPSGYGSGMKMTYADELVRFIREKTGDHFHIEVAAYPEVHPESATVTDDLRYFKQKVDAGANSALTQYFYNADAYFRYVEQLAAMGVDIPIVPGIMPITNYEGLVRFSARCQAEIPRWILKHLATYADDADSLRSFGDEVVTRLCQQLIDGGAPGLHFYTLNQANPTIRLCKALGLETAA